MKEADKTIHRFLRASPDSRERWLALDHAKFPGLESLAMPDGLTPLSGTPLYAGLTDGEKRSLALEFIKLNAEALILLEQTFLLAFRSRLRLGARDEGWIAAQKLAMEEYYHTRAFRRFLAREPLLRWPERALFIGTGRSPLAKRALGWLARHVPLSFCLPAAKIEAYSIAYSHTIKKEFGGWDTTLWAKIQQLHAADEAHHVGFQFSIYSHAFPGRSLLSHAKIWLGTFGFFLILQYLLVGGSWRMTRNALPERGFFSRFRHMMGIARWSVRQFPPYREGRLKTKRVFEELEFPMKRLLAYLHW